MVGTQAWQGWLYVALVIDCYSRMIVGWATSDNYKTPLITAAAQMAARNIALPPGAIFHSDRGSNYTSDEYANVSTGLGLRQSVGRTGICYDNALAESTNGALKVELVNPGAVSDPCDRHRRDRKVHRTVLQSPQATLTTRVPNTPRSPRCLPGSSNSSLKIPITDSGKSGAAQVLPSTELSMTCPARPTSVPAKPRRRKSG